ncbi:hypothetical protein [Treponema sp.]|uniref:endonuclease/exonuclease/phosphatase family protein n=1 Tax=Treponema sp. TaxID=166 RepID=UPI00298EA343|nr:hypothetical protein [Treponema sp.]MCR5612836.1 endonuclease/exonuclease/phosphatase family protein [Treponema sp.]
MQRIVSLFFLILVLFFGCYAGNNSGTMQNVTITNWNVQTFFDGNNDGIEYSEFRKADTWNSELYEQRIGRLCSMIKKFDSDILVMEEIENEKIIYDISNHLSENEWFKNKKYLYAAFGKNEGSSIGCAVLSKYKIEDVAFHNIDIRTEKEKKVGKKKGRKKGEGKMPDLRPIIELTINTDDRCQNGGHSRFKLFVNHWKSKSGGALESEKWRQWQETVLAGLLKSRNCAEKKREPEFFCIAAGDFNKDIGEFGRGKGKELYFTELDECENKAVNVYSPWNEYENQEKGSYYFNGKWERIDHFFCNRNEGIVKFTVEEEPEIINEDGTPARYQIFSKSGYSDHLPVTCTIKLVPDL